MNGQSEGVGVSSAVGAPSGLQLTLHQVRGLVAYTVRESLHRWTLLTYLFGITFFLMLLASAVNLDIVEGTLASARLFGQELQIGDRSVRVEDIVRFVQVGVVSMLYFLGVGLALFLTCNYVPSLAREGWVELLVAQPISRSALLLGRTLGALAVVAIGVTYLVGGTWLVLRLKTGFGSADFLVAGLMILFTYAVCYSATALIGIMTGSGPVSGIAGLMVFVMGAIMYFPHQYPEWRAALRAGWPRQLATALSEGLYWFLPKNGGLLQTAVNAARGEAWTWAPIVYSLPFAAFCLLVACWWFTRRDY